MSIASKAAAAGPVLRHLAAWMSIQPQRTYVASSIPGLGACKSTYCHAERRELPRPRSGAARPLLTTFTVALRRFGRAGRPTAARAPRAAAQSAP